MSGDLVKVRVVPGWAVFDGIAQRTGGDVIDVKPDVAADWIAAGWVELVTARRRSGEPHRLDTQQVSALAARR